MTEKFWQDVCKAENGPISIGLFSFGINKISHLDRLIGADKLVFRPGDSRAKHLDAIVGWGNKPNTVKGRGFAHKHSLPYVTMEDGWIKSFGLTEPWSQPLSVVLDDTGIYYDATRPSRLEYLIENSGGDDEKLARARRLRQRIVDLRITKYNHVNSAPVLPEGEKVLVVDQTFGDLSIGYGLADNSSFEEMLSIALGEHPEASIYLKVHPEVVSGKKRGHFDLDNLPERVKVLSENANPIELIRQMDHVHVVTSQLGFEALMLGKPVTCHGMPFYAGWGLTIDRQQCARRAVKRSIDEVFTAAYLDYARYLNPLTRQSCELEELLDVLETQLHWQRMNSGRHYCVGFRYWKHYIARAYLQGPASKVYFYKSLKQAVSAGLSAGDNVVVWSSRLKIEVADYCRENDIRLTRMEDGFLRSVGLGSDFVKPLSLVLDDRGIYYDPELPSQLEIILNTTEFSDEELQRAARLRESITDAGLSKYNVGFADSGTLTELNGKRKILVPGQVEDDASVKHGGGDIQSNLSLLQAVRQRAPDAFILYKEHPDVTAGNRKNQSSVNELKVFCDAYVTNVGIEHCLSWADEVHTLTSLTGFEALMRDIPVTTYGMPFYAGWGLCKDEIKLERRTRKLQLDELLVGALIKYPRYFDWNARHFMSPEMALEQLLNARKHSRKAFVSRVLFLKHGIIKCRQLINMIRY